MRIRILVSLVFLIPIGFYTKFYAGPAALWVNNSFGGVFYEIFWCLIATLVWPKASPLRIAATVFTLTSILEFAQLWHPVFLIPVRENFIGRTLIGHSFAWTDFLYYLIGSLLGALWISRIRKLSEQDKPS